MAHKEFLVALGMIVAASPAAASIQPETAAPPGGAETRYCMRVEAVTGTRLETIECWTRDEWASQGVDVDKDWPREGVRIIA